jgi:hypothetical protein
MCSPTHLHVDVHLIAVIVHATCVPQRANLHICRLAFECALLLCIQQQAVVAAGYVEPAAERRAQQRVGGDTQQRACSSSSSSGGSGSSSALDDTPNRGPAAAAAAAAATTAAAAGQVAAAAAMQQPRPLCQLKQPEANSFGMYDEVWLLLSPLLPYTARSSYYRCLRSLWRAAGRAKT